MDQSWSRYLIQKVAISDYIKNDIYILPDVILGYPIHLFLDFRIQDVSYGYIITVILLYRLIYISYNMIKYNPLILLQFLATLLF